jgi:hypothetical protein
MPWYHYVSSSGQLGWGSSGGSSGAARAAYLAHWLKVLKEDKRAIFSAAAHAQRAADFLNGLQPQQQQQPEEDEPVNAAQSPSFLDSDFPGSAPAPARSYEPLSTPRKISPIT